MIRSIPQIDTDAISDTRGYTLQVHTLRKRRCQLRYETQGSPVLCGVPQRLRRCRLLDFAAAHAPPPRTGHRHRALRGESLRGAAPRGDHESPARPVDGARAGRPVETVPRPPRRAPRRSPDLTLIPWAVLLGWPRSGCQPDPGGSGGATAPATACRSKGPRYVNLSFAICKS